MVLFNFLNRLGACFNVINILAQLHGNWLILTLRGIYSNGISILNNYKQRSFYHNRNENPFFGNVIQDFLNLEQKVISI